MPVPGIGIRVNLSRPEGAEARASAFSLLVVRLQARDNADPDRENNSYN